MQRSIEGTVEGGTWPQRRTRREGGAEQREAGSTSKSSGHPVADTFFFFFFLNPATYSALESSPPAILGPASDDGVERG